MKTRLKKIRVTSEGAGRRLDRFLAETDSVDLSRSRIQQLIRDRCVLVDGAMAKPKTLLNGGENITINVPPPSPSRLTPEDIPLDILFEDEDLLVLNKPPNLTVHPGAGGHGPTLVHALLYPLRGQGKKLSTIGGKERPGIVHRLDKDTSGILVIAKKDIAHTALAEQFSKRSVEKSYEAIVYGTMDADSGQINAAIERHPGDRKKMSCRRNQGRGALTRWKLIKNYRHFARVRAFPKTGRTHQIRVHLADRHHPIVGDKLYGRQRTLHLDPMVQAGLHTLDRQALHAAELTFDHPTTKERLSFQAPLPNDMLTLLNLLQKFDV